MDVGYVDDFDFGRDPVADTQVRSRYPGFADNRSAVFDQGLAVQICAHRFGQAITARMDGQNLSAGGSQARGQKEPVTEVHACYRV